MAASLHANLLLHLKVLFLFGAQREISAKRPLTKQIFLGIIIAGLDRMKLEGIDVSEFYGGEDPRG